MSYHALARKWRPHQFSELVGQDHVVRALKHGLGENRLHHALLFSGTRGVGKTTLGRLVAKGLNCEEGVTSEPCGQCRSCTEIDEGRFVDLIEVDAASRTGVDDTRELMENLQYAPAHGRRKVYLIDEVHMLSKSAFNALLKTLEEPPPHVQFLLATTDPQKLPITVLSRCLQFHLKRLPQSEIQQQLATVLQKEGIDSETDALAQLARAADGSMRDGLSLLDQAIAFGGGRVTGSDVAEMLGSIDRSEVLTILELLSSQDVSSLPDVLKSLDEQAPDYSIVLDELAASLQQLSMLQLVKSASLPDELQGHADAYQQLAASLTVEDVQLYYQIAVTGKRDLPLAPSPRIGFEMLLLRMLAFHKTLDGGTTAQSAGERPVPTRAVEKKPAEAAQKQAASRPVLAQEPAETTAAPTPQPAEAKPAQAATAPVANLTLDKVTEESWPATVAALGLRGMGAELARQTAWAGYADGRVHLEISSSFENLRSDRYCQLVQEALSERSGEQVKLEITVAEHDKPTTATCDAQAESDRMQQAEQAIHNDPTVQALQERFGASIHPGSVEPLS